MASHIEVKIGQLTYRHDFAETDTKVRGALQRFAASMEPPAAEDATPTEQLENATRKIVRLIAQAAKRARMAELQSEQSTNLEQQAETDTGLAYGLPEPTPTEQPEV